MGQIFTPTAETWPAAADAVVIGGGIVGAATVFWFARAGLDTVLLEMRSDLGSLTSAQSIESFRLQFTEPAMSDLAQESIRLYENFAELIGIPDYDIAMRHTGYLFVTDEPGMVDSMKAAVAKHHALGVTDSEFLTAAEIHAALSLHLGASRGCHLPPARRPVLQPCGDVRLCQGVRSAFSAEHPGHGDSSGRGGCVRGRDAAW